MACFANMELHRLRLCEVVRPLLVRRLHEVCGLPEVWSEVAVCLPQRLQGGLHEVALGPCVTARSGEAIGNPSECHDLLHSERADDAASARCRDEAHTHRARLAVNLHGHRVWQADTVTPVATAHWDEIKLR